MHTFQYQSLHVQNSNFFFPMALLKIESNSICLSEYQPFFQLKGFLEQLLVKIAFQQISIFFSKYKYFKNQLIHTILYHIIYLYITFSHFLTVHDNCLAHCILVQKYVWSSRKLYINLSAKQKCTDIANT